MAYLVCVPSLSFRRWLPFSFATLLFSITAPSFGQGFGIELHNTVMPASGGMGGASIARPQDVQSAINGNPATLGRYRGTQFGMSGAWIEPTINVSHTAGPAPLPGVGTFSAKSEAEGVALGNIAVTQELELMGSPLTMGLGLISGAGAGLSLRDVPASNGTTALIVGLEIVVGAGVELTDRLSVGANLMLGNATLDGPFVGLTAAVADYALRGSLGVNYDVGCDTTIGLYYQTEQSFNFDDAVRLQLSAAPITFGVVQDINLDLPANVGLGIANQSLMNGDLLLAVDVLYKQWQETALFGALYDNQWVVQLGAQYELNPRMRVRLGYAYAENAMKQVVGNSAGGVSPGVSAVNYLQALFPNINPHRISAGVGIRDVMPGLDFDLVAGGMFNASDTFGTSSVRMESYWIGGGMTWRFGTASSCRKCDGCDSRPKTESL